MYPTSHQNHLSAWVIYCFCSSPGSNSCTQRCSAAAAATCFYRFAPRKSCRGLANYVLTFGHSNILIFFYGHLLPSLWSGTRRWPWQDFVTLGILSSVLTDCCQEDFFFDSNWDLFENPAYSTSFSFPTSVLLILFYLHARIHALSITTWKHLTSTSGYVPPLSPPNSLWMGCYPQKNTMDPDVRDRPVRDK